jgi:hypothetical protein
MLRWTGNITEMVAFGNVVPTGLALRGNTIYLTQAGPIPHLPENCQAHVTFRQSRSPPRSGLSRRDGGWVIRRRGIWSWEYHLYPRSGNLGWSRMKAHRRYLIPALS